MVNNKNKGEILWQQKAGGTVKKGRLVYLNSSGQWKEAVATTVAEDSINLLGICLTNGEMDDDINVLLKGFVNNIWTSGMSVGTGCPLYMSTTTGYIEDFPPTGTGEVIRIIGHLFWDASVHSSGLHIIRFNPDNSWVEI